MQRIVSRREATTARETLAQLEKRYAAGKISRGQYLYQRESLHKIIALPVREDTKVKTNTQSWFARNWINNSPAPVGYFDFKSPTDGIQAPITVGNDMATIRNGMLNLAENEYWNANDLQQAIRQQSATVTNAGNTNNQQASTNFSTAVGHANQVNGLGRTAGTAADIIAELVNQPQVQAELKGLASSLSNLIRERVGQGESPYSAKSELISMAIQAGANLTELGYDPEAAATIVQKLMKGEITEMNAIYLVASDIKEANKILNSLGSKSNSSIGPASGLLDQVYAEPRSQGQKYISPNYNPHNMSPRISTLNMPYGTLDLPSLKQMAQQAHSNGDTNLLQQLEQAIAARESALNNVRRGNNTSQQISINKGISNEAQLRDFVNNSMPTTRKALNLQKPDLGTMLRDIFTIDGNLFFDHQKGALLTIEPNQKPRAAKKFDDPQYIRPKGEWTVYGMSRVYIANLEAIKQSLMYTLVPNYWTDAERTYLEFLRNAVSLQIHNHKQPLLKTIPNGFRKPKSVIQQPNKSANLANQLNPNQNQTEPEPEWAGGSVDKHPYMDPNGKNILHYPSDSSKINAWAENIGSPNGAIAKSESQHEYLHSTGAAHSPPPPPPPPPPPKFTPPGKGPVPGGGGFRIR